MSLSVSLQRPRGLVLGDLIVRGRGRAVEIARDALLVIGAAGFVGVLAQISIHLSFTPVPITGQTLGVLLAGTALGWRRAALSMGLYALAGVAGVPWFAGPALHYGLTPFLIGDAIKAAIAASLLPAAWKLAGRRPGLPHSPVASPQA